MDPKEKEKMAEELNVEETKDTAEEQPQNDQAEEAAPLTHEEQLEKELEDAQAVIEEQKDKYLRLSAEFDNYRKRTMKEKAELILNGGEKSISSILPVIDDFERAIKTMETAKDVKAVKEVHGCHGTEWCEGHRNERPAAGYRLSRSHCRHPCPVGRAER